MQSRRALLPIVLGLALLSAACGGSPSGTPDAGDTVNCASDSRVTAYTPNMTVNSKNGGMKVSLVSSPAPPAKGNNVWTLRITNGSGTPMPGLSLSYATLMPDHGHGSPISNPAITDKGGGTYDVNPVDLFMPGVWHVWFYTPSAATDTADFFFCVQG
jgi:hypothetical protein